MPFQFTGKLPTMQPNVSSFSSFAAVSAVGSSVEHVKPLPGAQEIPSDNVLSQSEHSDESTKFKIAVEKKMLMNAPDYDSLLQALRRGVTENQAMFGKKEKAADALVRDFKESTERAESSAAQLAEVSKALRDLGDESALGLFVRYLFNELIKTKSAATLPAPTTQPFAAETGFESVKSVEPVTQEAIVREARSQEPVLQEAVESSGGVREANNGTVMLSKQSNQDDSSAEKPFRLFDLPPELRVWIYRHVLAPGYIGLRNHKYGGSVRKRVAPQDIGTELLRTCKQVYKESRQLLLGENTICISVDSGLGHTAMINRSQVPDVMLSKLQDVTFVIDLPQNRNQEHVNLRLMDWRQFQAMTDLKKARICIADDVEQRSSKTRVTDLMELVIERLPMNCKITFGTEAAAEKEHMLDALRAFSEYSKRKCHEMDASEVEECAKDVLARQGCKSGHKRDYRYPERTAFQLKPLVSKEEMDESIILGR